MTIIDKDAWWNAINRRGKNPAAEDDIRDKTEQGEIVAVDKDGNRFVPKKNDKGDWTLIPEAL